MKPTDGPSEAFREWLKSELARREWISADLARRMGSSNGTVSNWVTGKRRPSPETVRRIAKALGADVDNLLTLAAHRPPDPYYDPDSPEAQLVPLIRQIDWESRPGRLEEVQAELRFMIDVDRRSKRKGGTR